MRYYRLAGGGRDAPADSLVVVDEEGDAYDLTTASADLGPFTALARAANACDCSVDDIAGDRIADAEAASVADLDRAAGLPVVAEDVWAAGVTYRISEQAARPRAASPRYTSTSTRATDPNCSRRRRRRGRSATPTTSP